MLYTREELTQWLEKKLVVDRDAPTIRRLLFELEHNLVERDESRDYRNPDHLPKIKDEYGNTDWRDTGEMGG